MRRTSKKFGGALRLRAAILAAFVGSASSALAEEFVIRDIRVEGVQRTETGTVFSHLPVHVGDRYDPAKGIAAVRSLYETGLFKDIRIEADGDVLVVIVEERPAIAAVELSGMKEFDKDAVKKSLKEVGLTEARVYDRSLLDRAEQELKRQYLTRGLYGVKITTTVTPVERNRVNVSIAIDEGELAKIRVIQFTGNHVFSDSTLREQMELSTPGWFTWYTNHDKYARQKLQADEETLRSYYLARGYLDFNIESTQVTISQDKKDIFITINLVEGDRYTISGVKLAGETLGLDDEFRKMIDVKPGDIYSGERMTAIAKRMTDRLSVLGYAFATANPVPEANKEKREVAFTFLIDPGRRAYVRHVNIIGNTHTRDEVIRREIRQFESSWYDADKVRLSRDRIDRLGFFEKVEVETPAVPATQDQIDVNYTVKEKPNGTIQAGAGYSSTEHLVLSGSYTQQNVFGTGHAIGIQINTSYATRTVVLSHVDPYMTEDGISRTDELYQRFSNLSRLNLATVDIGTKGFSERFGIPLTEFDTVFLGLGVEETDITLSTYSPSRYINYVNEFGTTAAGLIATAGWARDNRDNVIAPTRGNYQRAFLEVGTPYLDLQYYKATYQYQQFQPLTNRFTLAFNGQVGYGGTYNGETFPIFKNFYAGGIGSVRGYQAGTLGPRDTNGNPLGGTKEVNGSIEALAPLPGADRSLRALTFVDGGEVWGSDQSVYLSDLQFSFGVGIAWVSPIGPLKLSLAFPFHRQPGDQIQRFQFQIGTGF
ncbi:Outer membrane protein assembly factor BamA [Burkholderiales bacterium]|jgi:outer membrane protein insertion porin family|nr:Outer membrane protein assembly factor BamA [Burkholderiales bacterium]